MQTHHIELSWGWRGVQLLHTDATTEPSFSLVRDVFNGDVFWVQYMDLVPVVMQSEYEQEDSLPT